MFKRATPDFRRAITINAMGKGPSAFLAHARNDSPQAVDDMIKGVDIVIKHDHACLWISLGLLGLFKYR